MTITNEAAYLYVFSKKLISVNKKIHSLREDGRKAMERLHQTSDSVRKERYQNQSQKAADKLKKAIEERQSILAKLHRHQVAFAGQLRTEAGK
ncbi:MAG TPA: hypothetical protein VJI32_03585 [Candidatus Nanoarchaeia archaeon]|nr:hypothetical protein [Candidatus Nanoarchaeia archaeon]